MAPSSSLSISANTSSTSGLPFMSPPWEVSQRNAFQHGGKAISVQLSAFSHQPSAISIQPTDQAREHFLYLRDLGRQSRVVGSAQEVEIVGQPKVILQLARPPPSAILAGMDAVQRRIWLVSPYSSRFWNVAGRRLKADV